MLDKKSCFGCGVCAVACPHKAISIKLNKKGFYAPVIDTSCTNCGLCIKICPLNNKSIPSHKSIGYSSWSKDHIVRYITSSGGTTFEIIRHMTKKGYKTIGARYNNKEKRVEHYISNNLYDAYATIGSKYLQSYTVDALNNINSNDKYLIIGTPCQIAAIRSYLKKKNIEDNSLLIDFFCHGVPSMLLWNKYVSENKILQDNSIKISWRDKNFGWHNSWNITAKKSNQYVYYSKTNRQDIFYKFFLNHLCLCDSCYKDCIYKGDNSCADIRVGDFWDIVFADNDKGVNSLLALNNKGRDVLDEIKNLDLKVMDLNIVLRGQMKSNASPSNVEFIVLKLLKTCLSLKTIYILAKLLSNVFKLVKGCKIDK
jgi:coenzyme F420-reducing hydrogenase beta subunit